MEHHHHMHHHNPPLHWGYSGTAPHNTWIPPPTTRASSKRTLSDSDLEEVYSETSSKDQ